MIALFLAVFPAPFPKLVADADNQRNRTEKRVELSQRQTGNGEPTREDELLNSFSHDKSSGAGFNFSAEGVNGGLLVVAEKG